MALAHERRVREIIAPMTSDLVLNLKPNDKTYCDGIRFVQRKEIVKGNEQVQTTHISGGNVDSFVMVTSTTVLPVFRSRLARYSHNFADEFLFERVLHSKDRKRYCEKTHCAPAVQRH